MTASDHAWAQRAARRYGWLFDLAAAKSLRVRRLRRLRLAAFVIAAHCYSVDRALWCRGW